MVWTIKKLIKFPIIVAKSVVKYFYIKNFLNKYRNDTLVWIYPHIGDMFYSLLYISQFKQQKAIKSLRIIGNEKYGELYRYFEGIDSFVLLKEKYVWRFSFYKSGYFARKLIYKSISNRHFITNDFEFMKKIITPNEGEGCLNYTKRVIYNLPTESRFNKPHFPKQYIEGYNYKRMVILSPYAQSVSLIDNNFFESIVCELVQKGFDVYTNVSRVEHEIAGTKRLECSLLELYNIARNARAFIGLRSGLCDLIAMTNIPMYVFFNGYPLGKFATLCEYRSDIKEFYGKNFFEYQRIILEDFCDAT